MCGTVTKITVNVPQELLKSAVAVTGRGITETVVEGLKEIEKREKRQALRQLQGKIQLQLDLRKTRR